MNCVIVFIHSAGPQDQNQGSSNLIAYVKQELGSQFKVICPKMPAPEDPTYAAWKEQIDLVLDKLSGEVLLVGHSLGGSVLFKYLSEELYHVKVSGLFTIAAPYWGIDEDWNRSDFFLRDDFEQHLKEIPQVYLYHSHDEEIVPFSHYLAYIERLPHSKRREIEGKEHLFLHGLPQLIKDVRRLSSMEVE